MKDPAFPFYAQDFLLGTMYMDFSDTGRYIKLLAYQWDNLHIPKKRLGLLVGLSWDLFSDDLREKFNEDENYIWNDRLEVERNKRLQFKEKQKLNGIKGGRPKNPSLNFGLTQKKPLENESDNEYENEIKVINEVVIFKSLNIEFETFWKEYDKKVGDKSKLEKKWALLTNQERELIIKYIPNYKLSQPDKKYRKDPSTFLNNKSWNDELIFSNGQTFNNNPKSKLAGNIKAAEQLNREIEEKSRNFVSPMHQTG